MAQVYKSPTKLIIFNHKIIITLLSLVMIGWLSIIGISRLGVEILWFDKLGYLETFWTQFKTKLLLGLGTFSISLFFLLTNIVITNKQVDHQQLYKRHKLEKFAPQSSPLGLKSLLFLLIMFSLAVGLSIIFYTQTANQAWMLSINLPNVQPRLESPFRLGAIAHLLGNISTTIWQGMIVLTIVILLLTKTRFWLTFTAFYASVIFALINSGYWIKFLQFFNSVDFGKTEPLFNHEISFYIFKLPFIQIIDIWIQGLFFYSISASLIIYLISNRSISEGEFKGLSRYQLRHIYILLSGLMFTIAIIHWLNRYGLVFSKRGVVYGAGYTDININLPLETTGAIIALGIGIWLLIKSVTGYGKENKNKKGLPFSLLPFICYVVFYGGGLGVAEIFQNTIVQPNEFDLEQTYIERNIQQTRAAFNLDEIDVRTFNPDGSLTLEDIQENNLTIDNIRLWDSRPILEANRQLQQIRPYYVFPDADIDRYNIKNDQGNSDYTQVIVAPRELDYELVPEQAKTWVNEHLTYTHGYGFTMSPVNRVQQGGLPFYFISDIGSELDPGELRVSSPAIRESLPVVRPRIYFGELTNTYVMTNTKFPEFDFPSAEENFSTTYGGLAGINIANPWNKFAFAVHLRDWRMLLTDNFTPESRILFRRNINERIKAIAPFLYYDRDPYLVVADGQPDDSNHLYWLIDAYTISNYYPYSDPGENQFNYIRNSVKVLVDAYNGRTTFYISEEKDPLIRSWKKIFPELFQPLENMPSDLIEHIRYPIDLFSTQSERLLTYHVQNTQVFYNREDQWQIPEEIYGDEALSINPYYLIMKLPIADQEEFILLHPYTPISRPNLIAWLAARSDGENYGKLLLYQFPKQELVFGPDQIEALINQDPLISGQISLWNRQGSKAIQGNLLVIPIEQSLLYVEPVYLEADQNSIPALTRVIVVYDNRIVMANSLQEAIDGVFASPEDTSPSTIIRPLRELGIE
ncbi:UPF0182 family protein [Cyanobacterium stanieri LEGE 03274]|uniref:UPF0182 protein IQ215_09750 n=1 Tax=Cyanobacterium stanieri LEGE 03274 TaxID=1828756 RepID=A0ABR9V519_9CHRO|nr:UPF0182 family protein [Cyanobacterium stanieri]MBE9222977.1 UPF0182 family protein [Cyanobacterium stanieri LEGE 03274]